MKKRQKYPHNHALAADRKKQRPLKSGVHHRRKIMVMLEKHTRAGSLHA